jgi:hypothetical protein
MPAIVNRVVGVPARTLARARSQAKNVFDETLTLIHSTFRRPRGGLCDKLALHRRPNFTRIGQPAVALASGTAAQHLALRLLGVGPGDECSVSTLTFSAAANAILFQGGVPRQNRGR